MSKQNIYTIGGAVPLDRTYIVREADATLFSLCQEGKFAYVLTARQLGKSSLRRRIVQELVKEGIVPIDIDLTAIGTPENISAWYLGLLTVAEDILLENGILLQTDVMDYWQKYSYLGPTQRFTRYFQQVLLLEIQSPIVVLIDEIDTTLNLAYKNDFFATIRYFHEARFNYPAFQRLSFVLIGVATPTDLINDPQRTPFNIGERVILTDFTSLEAQPLVDGLGLPLDKSLKVLEKVIAWTGGHPYLTQRMCAELAKQYQKNENTVEIDHVVQQRFLADGLHGDDNLKWVGDFLIRGAPDGKVNDLIKIYWDIRQGITVFNTPPSPLKTHLMLSGLVREEGNLLKVRNPIYEAVFNSQWIKEKRLGPFSEELQRMRSRNIILGVSLLILLVMLVPTGWRLYLQLVDIRVINAVRTSEAPIIDGRLDDVAWTQAQPFTFAHHGAANGNTTADVSLLWDQEYLYVGFDVKDSQVEGASDPWNGDSVSVVLGNGLITEYRHSLTGANRADRRSDAISEHWLKSGTTFDDPTNEDAGYSIELQIRWAFEPESRKKIAIDFLSVDHDLNPGGHFDDTLTIFSKISWDGDQNIDTATKQILLIDQSE